MDFIKLKKILCIKDTIKKVKTTHRKGKNICKLNIWQEVNIQNLWRISTTQQDKEPNQQNKQRTSIDISPYEID